MSRRTLPPSATMGGTDSIVGWEEVETRPQFQRKAKKEERGPSKLGILCLTKMSSCILSSCVHCSSRFVDECHLILLGGGLHITFTLSISPYFSFLICVSLFSCEHCLSLLLSDPCSHLHWTGVGDTCLTSSL